MGHWRLPEIEDSEALNPSKTEASSGFDGYW